MKWLRNLRWIADGNRITLTESEQRELDQRGEIWRVTGPCNADGCVPVEHIVKTSVWKKWFSFIGGAV